MGFSSKNTGVGGCPLLQGVFPTQGSNLVSYVSCIGRRALYHEHHWGSPKVPWATPSVSAGIQSCGSVCGPYVMPLRLWKV